MLWRPRAEYREPVTLGLIDAARQRRDQEYRRLLYVAMTRAEDRLYIGGYETRRKPADSCWYRLIERGLGDIATACEIDLTLDAGEPTGWRGAGLRLTHAQDADPDKADTRADGPAPSQGLPAWAAAPAPMEASPPTPLAPSRPDDDEPPIVSPIGDDDGRRFVRGILIHELLQFLPDAAADSRADLARRFLSRPVHGLDPEAREALAREVIAVIEAPEFAELFGPNSRAEVPLVGTVGEISVSGQVDRLVVTGRDVLVVDYKSNRPPPKGPDDVAPLYLGQLAAYRAVLREIYPEFSITCALLWTYGPEIMPIPGRLLDSHAP